MKHLLLPVAFTCATAAWVLSLGAAQEGAGGNRGTPMGKTPMLNQPTGVSASAPTPTLNLLAGIASDGAAHLITVTPFSSTTFSPYFGANVSGLSNLPTTLWFSMSGGMGDGGNIYHSFAAATPPILVGPSGFGAVPGLAWDLTGTKLYGTATVSVLSDGLIEINPFTGAGTLVGPMGGGIGGIDGIGFHPTTGILYGSTGFFFDGSPGDVIEINPTTGSALKTGTMSPVPPCTISGMTFSNVGRGYVSVGCGPAFGQIYSWDTTTNVIVFIGDVGAFSVTDIEALF